MLETRDLTIRFGGHVAVDAVSCAFQPGTLTAIVGPNGAGKTTFFNLDLRPAAAHLRGRAARTAPTSRALPVAARTHLGIGRAFQLTQLFPHPLRARERRAWRLQSRRRHGLDLWSVWRDRRDTLERAQALARSSVALGDRAGMPTASSLPHGDQRKLEVAMLMALEPSVFMFDEPTAGMSVEDAPVILDLIRGLKAEADKTILLVEHKMDVVRELADRIVVLHNGRLVADGRAGGRDRLCRSCKRRIWASRRRPRPTARRSLEHSRPCCRCGACTRTSGRTTSSTASTSRCRRAQVTMLLGRNGAGKTTTLRTVMGLWSRVARQQSCSTARRIGGVGGEDGHGAMTTDGKRSGTARAMVRTPEIARLGIAYVPENMGIFSDLSVRENMLLAARDARRRIDDLDTVRLEWLFGLFPALKTFWLHPAGKLSGGQKQMLAIARAMIEPRRLLLIDEPSKGLAPAIVIGT